MRDLRPLGRNAQGFRLMNVREDDLVSAVALVMETETTDAVADDGAGLARRLRASRTSRRSRATA